MSPGNSKNHGWLLTHCFHCVTNNIQVVQALLSLLARFSHLATLYMYICLTKIIQGLLGMTLTISHRPA